MVTVSVTSLGMAGEIVLTATVYPVTKPYEFRFGSSPTVEVSPRFVLLPSNGNVSTSLTIRAGTAVGTYNVHVTGTGGPISRGISIYFYVYPGEGALTTAQLISYGTIAAIVLGALGIFLYFSLKKKSPFNDQPTPKLQQ